MLPDLPSIDCPLRLGLVAAALQRWQRGSASSLAAAIWRRWRQRGSIKKGLAAAAAIWRQWRQRGSVKKALAAAAAIWQR
jgi:hypothetical protein